MAAGRKGDARRRRLASRPGPAVLAAVLAAATACGSSSTPGSSTSPASSPPGPGVIFSAPADGQWDVPVRARVLLGFSRAVASTVDTACARVNGQVTGAFCVEGPDGFVRGALTVDGATLVFVPDGGLAPGATYQVWARPALLPGATNLPADAPLLTFHTRSTRTRAGAAATVLTLNGAPLGADGTSPRPFYDIAPVRLVFSEPLDTRTVGPGTVRLVRAATGAAVDGIAVAEGVHLCFDPSEALSAGDTYRLEVDATVRDLGGEPIAPVSATFTPRRSAAPGQALYPLPVSVAPPWTAGVSQPASRIGGMAANTYALSSLLGGDTTGGVLAGGLDALAGDPAAGPTIPLVIRRGGRVDLTPAVVRTGGVVDTGVSTGTIHATLLTDAFGFLMRNPFRSAEQQPDDAESPNFVDVTVDAVLTSDDPIGNALFTQTVMGIRLLGIATVDGDRIAAELVSAFDYRVLGLEAAPARIALRLRTGDRTPAAGLAVPVLTASSPVGDARDVAPGDPLELDFSGPLEPTLRPGFEVALLGSTAPVAAELRLDGSTVTLVPSRRLEEGNVYTVHWSGLRAISGGTLPSGVLSFTSAVNTASPPVPPIVLALYPGAPCALTGATPTSPGRCAGGRATDSGYLPFTLPADHDVRAYFSLPIDPASVTIGTACGQGSVRVERLGAGGQCAGLVPGTLVKLDRELRFVPDAPWTPGAAYRLTLVAGGNATCDPGEICGRNRLPLNTDPLAGVANGAGGPDLVIDFTGTLASGAVFQPFAAEPVADTNANGHLDGNEVPNDRNRTMEEITGVQGNLFSSVTLDGPDCSPSRSGTQACGSTTTAIPSVVRGVRDSCPVDPQGNAATMPYPCVEVQAIPHVLLRTSTSVTATSPSGTKSSPSGLTVVRAREPGKPILGYIFNEPGQPDPQFLLVEDTYLDAPDLVLQSGVTHDLHSKPLRTVLKGPVTYRPDGRTVIALRSVSDSLLDVVVTGPAPLTSTAHVRTPAGELRVTLVEPPKR